MNTICTLLFLLAPATYELKMAQTPVAQQPIELTLMQQGQASAGLEITATYRQNAHAKLTHQQLIGTSDARGRLHWTPSEPGVVVLSWPGGSQNVSVLHPGVPFSGVLVAILAGLLLLGGTCFFLIQMLRGRE